MTGQDMDTARRERADAWLARLGEWSGHGAAHKRKALACEVVRGIVDVGDPEYAYAVEWATGLGVAGEPSAADWDAALQLYGPVFPDDYARTLRARKIAPAAVARDGHAVRVLVR